MSYTRKQIKEYVRVKAAHLKNDAVVNTFLDVEINLSVTKVQKDVMAAGLKKYTKQVFGVGSAVAAPSDMQDVPNAIIDVKASIGGRASCTTAFSGANNDITFTMNEPGTDGNIADVIAMVDGLGAGTNITVTYNSDGTLDQILIEFAPGATSLSIITAVNIHPVASLIITAANAAGNNGTGTITLGVGVTFSTTGGTLQGFYPCDEIDVDHYNRIMDVSMITPSQTQPKYMLAGTTTTAMYLQFLPKSITYVLIFYKYWVADMTADTDTLAIGKGFEELVLLDVLSKVFGLLAEQETAKEKILEYTNEKTKLVKNYQDSLAAMVQEKTRIQSTDKNS
jgi:hypothetical protein